MIRSRSGGRWQTRKTRRQEANVRAPMNNSGTFVVIVTGSSLTEVLKMKMGKANEE